jgi:hypothetical protein
VTISELSDATWLAQQSARGLRDKIIAIEAAATSIEIPSNLAGEISHLRRIRKEIEATRNGDPPMAHGIPDRG